jgi:NAD(P)-dependent dehydrogenase (short-subunit alcohol dehydrogenase family)
MSASTPRAVLITGAARRIGRAVALDLAERGWPVAVHYHSSAADAQGVVEAIAKKGGKAIAIKADLRKEDEVAALIPRVSEQIGPVTCLINNASLFENDTVQTVTAESWHAHMQVNLRAPFVLIQTFAKYCPKGTDGNVINMIDERVWNLTPYFMSYTVSKVGLWTLTRTLAMALAPDIRVNGIGPGPTLPSAQQTEEQFRRQWSMMPLRRPISLEEICRAVRFILDAPSMTGQMIALDGGQHLGWAQPTPVNKPQE